MDERPRRWRSVRDRGQRLPGGRGRRSGPRGLRVPRHLRDLAVRDGRRSEVARRVAPLRGAHLRRRRHLDDRGRDAERPGAARHDLRRRLRRLRQRHAQPARLHGRDRRQRGPRPRRVRRRLRRLMRHRPARELHRDRDDRAAGERQAAVRAVRPARRPVGSARRGEVVRRAAARERGLVVGSRRPRLPHHRLQRLPPHCGDVADAAGDGRRRRPELHRHGARRRRDVHLRGQRRERRRRGPEEPGGDAGAAAGSGRPVPRAGRADPHRRDRRRIRRQPRARRAVAVDRGAARPRPEAPVRAEGGEPRERPRRHHLAGRLQDARRRRPLGADEDERARAGQLRLRHGHERVGHGHDCRCREHLRRGRNDQDRRPAQRARERPAGPEPDRLPDPDPDRVRRRLGDHAGQRSRQPRPHRQLHGQGQRELHRPAARPGDHVERPHGLAAEGQRRRRRHRPQHRDGRRVGGAGAVQRERRPDRERADDPEHRRRRIRPGVGRLEGEEGRLHGRRHRRSAGGSRPRLCPQSFSEKELSMRLRLLALCILAGGVLLLAGSAGATATDTFSGTITPTTCGPMHAVPVVQGDTTIDAVAAAYVSSNDIMLDLYDPNGKLLVHGDTLTSPESLHYASDHLAAGTYHLQVCPFGGTYIQPYDYTGSYAVTNGPPVGIPGSDTGGEVGPPTIKRITGKLLFSPATVVDAQRTEGEPLDTFDKDGNLWESGPWGTTTQNSFIHRSTDNGLEFHIDSPNGLRPDPGPGGGDTDIVTDDQGFDYFVDLESLVNLGPAVSNDNGNNWRKTPAAVQNTAVDRQWFAIDNGTTSSAADNTVFLAFHESAVGTFIYSSPGSTGSTDPVGGLVWQNSSANAPLPLASDATCAQLRFDPGTRNLYYACNEGDHIRITVGHVNPSQRTGIAFTNYKAPQTPGGQKVLNLFPALATDKAGGVYVAWIDGTNFNLYYSFSTDQGKTWSAPAKVNSGAAVTNEFDWAQGGAAGTLALAWYATDRTTPTGSDGMPNYLNNPAGAIGYPWYGYAALIKGANTATPTIGQARFTEKPMHYGQICNAGINCTVSGGDRQMADFFGFAVGTDGGLRIVYNDTTNTHDGAGLEAARQIAGATVLGGGLKGSPASGGVSAATGDAQWPHYGVPGANVPQLDLTGAKVSVKN